MVPLQQFDLGCVIVLYLAKDTGPDLRPHCQVKLGVGIISWRSEGLVSHHHTHRHRHAGQYYPPSLAKISQVPALRHHHRELVLGMMAVSRRRRRKDYCFFSHVKNKLPPLAIGCNRKTMPFSRPYQCFPWSQDRLGTNPDSYFITPDCRDCQPMQNGGENMSWSCVNLATMRLQNREFSPQSFKISKRWEGDGGIV